ncbi:MAG: peptidoglycan DD-metalloendopeptidase family protein [Roseburia sp.]
MQKINFTKKELVQAIVTSVGAAALGLLALSQKVGIGQAYQSVSINNQIVGYTAKYTDVRSALMQARRELSLESGERLCMNFEWETQNLHKPFETLLSAEELKEELKEILKEEILCEKERAYTVAIGEYRANFASVEEVKSFLNKVKANVDGESRYMAELYREESGHIQGILQARLTEAAPTEAEVVPVMREPVRSGVIGGVNYALNEAMEKSLSGEETGGYKTGILDMEFVERVEVYENYVSAEELSDVDEEVIEVTKEKESNKIYVVESGDCLSVIALDRSTTVASIVALNNLKDADSIREGQELIIAVPEPDLKLRVTMGEVYEEDYNEEPIIIENDSWYTTDQRVHEEGSVGHRERNDVVVYENGMEVSRNLLYENVMTASTAAVIERGTLIPPTYIRPLSGGRFTSGFGMRWGLMHKGVDWGCPVGTTVYASSGGTVIQASYNGGYGNNVVISHPDGRMTRYAHNSKLLVSVGQRVEQGEPVALSGNTGRSTGPHLHFELYINGVAVDPLKYIGR